MEKELFEMIENMMGYVGNGTQTSVTLSQDDATWTYCVRVGKKEYHGQTLNVAIRKAYSCEKQEH